MTNMQPMLHHNNKIQTIAKLNAQPQITYQNTRPTHHQHFTRVPNTQPHPLHTQTHHTPSQHYTQMQCHNHNAPALHTPQHYTHNLQPTTHHSTTHPVTTPLTVVACDSDVAAWTAVMDMGRWLRAATREHPASASSASAACPYLTRICFT